MSVVVIEGDKRDLAPLDVGDIAHVVNTAAMRILYGEAEADAAAIARSILFRRRPDLTMAQIFCFGDVLATQAIERARTSTSSEKARCA